MRQRPGLDRTLALDLLNERMRHCIDQWTWSDLVGRVVLSIPQAYSKGTIALTTNSRDVVGTGTDWPVSDVVNTTCQEIVPAGGNQWVTPASMAGITRNTVLYVDAAVNPEVCAVQDIIAGRILLGFQYAHASGFTVTASSLAGLQLRVGMTTPIFTVNAITSATTLKMDNAWGNSSQTGSAYQMALIYTTFAEDVKTLDVVTDPFQQIKLRLHVSEEELNLYDPNRTSTNSPILIADLGPNLCGNQLYEIYPPQTTSYQLWCLYTKQWPDMRLPGDRPPPFMNPNVLTWGALADAFRTPCGRPPDYKDPYFNPQTALTYEAQFEKAFVALLEADQGKSQKLFDWNYSQTFGATSMGSNWNQDHDFSAATGDY